MRKISLATSRCQNQQVPAFSKLFGATNSGTQPSQRKACHCYWKPILNILWRPGFLGRVSQKRTTNHAYTPTKIGGMLKEAHHRHSHFHIFASLPGLNGTATNRQRMLLFDER